LITSHNVGGVWPSRVTHWEGFLNEVNQHNFDETKRFERPHFNKNLKQMYILLWKSIYLVTKKHQFSYNDVFLGFKCQDPSPINSIINETTNVA